MKLIPKLRFPEFINDGEWTKVALCELGDIKKGKQLNRNNLTETGKYPCQNGGINPSGYTNKFNSQENTITISEGGNSCGFVNFMSSKFWLGGHCYKISPKKDIIQLFLYQLLKFNEVNIMTLRVGSGLPNIQVKELRDFEVTFTNSRSEQRKIASCLSSLDDLIFAHNEKLAALQEHKKGLMQNLFPQEGETVPKYRFPEFEKDGEWEIKSIERNIDLICGIALKSKQLTDDKSGTPIIRGINITEGHIRHSAEMDKFYIGDVSEIEKYLVHEKDIVIGMDGSKVGKNVSLISKQDAGSILIQRVARVRAINADVDYLYQHFVSYDFRNYVDIVNTSSGIPHISAKQIKNYKIGFPPKMEEQRKIASCLSALDMLITSEAEKIEQLQQHKKGLMQGLFPKLKAKKWQR